MVLNVHRTFHSAFIASIRFLFPVLSTLALSYAKTGFAKTKTSSNLVFLGRQREEANSQQTPKSHRDTETDRQTDRQKDTDRQTKTERQTDRQTDRQTEEANSQQIPKCHRETQTDTQTDRQTERKTDRGS